MNSNATTPAPTLHGVHRGAPDDPIGPLVLAHGFTQNAACWGPFADGLAARTEVTCVDLPGHGATHPDHDHVSLSEAGTLLANSTLPAHSQGPATHIGYSMGGRIALHGALSDPTRMRALVLIGATAGIPDVAERHARQQSDEALADTAIDLGIDGFIDQWLEHPLFAHLSPGQAMRRERCTNRIEGLAATLRCRGTGAQQPLHDELHRISMPVLIIAGEHDEKFRQLGSELAQGIGENATTGVVPNAGHACHLEQPNTTAQMIIDWLDAA